MIFYLSLGSNKGAREQYIQRAFDALEQIGTLRTRSRFYETEAWGRAGQTAFLNVACVLETSLRPLRLLRKLKQIETRLGRRRNVRWGAREIDIDIIDWDGNVLQTNILTIPHLMMKQRAFVLQPLAEIAPNYVSREGYSVAQLLSAESVI